MNETPGFVIQPESVTGRFENESIGGTNNNVSFLIIVSCWADESVAIVLVVSTAAWAKLPIDNKRENNIKRKNCFTAYLECKSIEVNGS